MTVRARLDLRDLGFDRGGHILVKHQLRSIAAGEVLEVCGHAPELAVHLRAWCRAQGHDFEAQSGPRFQVRRGSAENLRWRGAERAGDADPLHKGALAPQAPAHWGLAARGAMVETGGPQFHFDLDRRDVVWAEEVPRLYAQAVASQWDPASAVDWTAPIDHDETIEDAVVQVMTYLVENETAALLIPARFAGRLHPHFREVLQLLAIQAADEARHIEVFTRRARLRRQHLGLSTIGGQASLKTLLDEPDFALASFLLSVLGEGSFLSLLWFLHQHGPDPITRTITRLAAQDEARHVAFGMAHLTRHLQVDPSLRQRLETAVEQRHQHLSHTAGLNEEVFDALVVLAAGCWSPQAIAKGHDVVMQLKRDMDDGRQRRLAKLGFSDHDAARLSALHTRNFM